MTDPLAFTGCGRTAQAALGPDEDQSRGLGPGQIPHQVALGEEKVSVGVGADEKPGTNGHPNGSPAAKKLVNGLTSRNGIAKAIAGVDRPVHPVTLWRGRLSVAIDALESRHRREPIADAPRYERRSPVETTNVQLPTGDRLLVPTGAETLRLKGYLIMCRNSRRDYAEFADMVERWSPRPPLWCWPEWTGTTVVNHPGGSGLPPSWSVDSQIRTLATTRKTRDRKPRPTRTGRESGSAACPWR